MDLDFDVELLLQPPLKRQRTSSASSASSAPTKVTCKEIEKVNSGSAKVVPKKAVAAKAKAAQTVKPKASPKQNTDKKVCSMVNANKIAPMVKAMVNQTAKAATVFLRVGSDCSGVESLLKALESIGVKYTYMFGSDISSEARMTLRANYGRDHILYKDLRKRNHAQAPQVDLYHAGFPCQPFSTAGKGRGTSDERGKLIYSILAYVEKHTPKMVLLENVKGLLAQRHRGLLKFICDKLTAFGYHVSTKLLNARYHGVPQNRERVFILGILSVKSKVVEQGFQWPDDQQGVALNKFLEPKTASETHLKLPPETQATARRNVQRALVQVQQDGHDAAKVPCIVDCDSSKGHLMYRVSPCLTRPRASGGGHWVLHRGRRVTIQEMERLFGYGVKPPSGGQLVSLARPAKIANRHWGALLGNSIPVPLLGRILCRALPAAGLTGPLPDVWACRPSKSAGADP